MAKEQRPFPTRDDAWNGASLCLGNYKRHHDSAERLAASGEFGQAVSLLVLAAEELMKASSLLLYSLGAPPDHLRDLLQYHRPRHDFANIVFGLLTILGTMLESQLSVDRSASASEHDRHSAQLRAMEDTASDLIKRIDDPDDYLHQVRDWWPRAGALKNRGFYVDYTSAGWLGPGDVREADYVQARDIVVRSTEFHRAALTDMLSMPGEELAAKRKELAEQMAGFRFAGQPSPYLARTDKDA